ncbi:NfeD family protein [Roseateles oligotrophus]|uniref:NfeD family protein n=1 Tax=Roseateles oligotrophus TaxID=1769250 RepID=A0ABT2YFN3_9BURK|nr:NfeD family protein [Roseateles oligotrophus]MCV2368852.1 NfeD family protein [Roseateles oligotrophus]
MEMTLGSTWWVACGILVAVELSTGTFYLLMLALGCAAGAVASHLGLSESRQMLSAAVIGGAAVAACYLLRRNALGASPAGANADANMDIGQTVEVASWEADGSTRVKYRGASWQASYIGSAVPGPTPGPYVIRAIEGSRLRLDHQEAL